MKKKNYQRQKVSLHSFRNIKYIFMLGDEYPVSSDHEFIYNISLE